MKIVITLTHSPSEKSSHLRKGLYDLIESLGTDLTIEPNSKQEWQVLTAWLNGCHYAFEQEVDKIFDKLK